MYKMIETPCGYSIHCNLTGETFPAGQDERTVRGLVQDLIELDGAPNQFKDIMEDFFA